MFKFQFFKIHYLSASIINFPYSGISTKSLGYNFLPLRLSNSPLIKTSFSCKNHFACPPELMMSDRKSTRLNSSHVSISYAVFCLKKKNKQFHYYAMYSRL